MEYKLLYTSDHEFEDKHDIHSLYYFCMDARFQSESQEFKNFLHRDSYDRQIVAGGSLVFFTEEYCLPPAKDFMLFSADFAQQYHHIKEIILCDHDDCGAYRSVLAAKLGKDREDVTLDEIKAEQERNLVRAKEMLSAHYPEIKITIVRAVFDSERKHVQFFELI